MGFESRRFCALGVFIPLYCVAFAEAQAADTSWVTNSPAYVSPPSAVRWFNPAPCPYPNNPADPANLQGATWGSITIHMNGCWGGAVYDYSWNGHQFENNIGTGALFNIDTLEYQSLAQFVGHPASAPVINPTEAGDVYNNGAGVVSWGFWGTPQNSSGMYSITNPLDFGGTTLNEAGTVYDAFSLPNGNTTVMFGGLTFTAGVVPRFSGFDNVTAFESIVTSSVAQSNIAIQIPAVYLRANFDTITTYNVGASFSTNTAVAQTAWNWIEIPTPARSPNRGSAIVTTANNPVWGGGEWLGPYAGRYAPYSYSDAGVVMGVGGLYSKTCGVVSATDLHNDADFGYTLGVYGCTPDQKNAAGQSGSVSYFTVANASADWTESSSNSNQMISINPMYSVVPTNGAPALPAGSSVFISYIITGSSLNQVLQTAQQLYLKGVR